MLVWWRVLDASLAPLRRVVVDSCGRIMNARRGFANAHQSSDNEARNTNLTLMQQKRKRQLEEQLENKEELLRQYTNPRGIGMRGQTVPQRDVDMLKEQIEQIRRQLAEMLGQAGPVATPSSLATPSGQSQSFQPVIGSTPSTNATPIAGTPVSAGRPTQQGNRPPSKREQVWNAKYQQWLQRERESRQGGRSAPPSQPNAVPPLAVRQNQFAPVPVEGSRSTNRDLGFTPQSSTASTPAQGDARFGRRASASGDSRQAMPQSTAQGDVRFGRRATPPSEAARPAVNQAQWQQPQQRQQQASQQQAPWQQPQQSQQQAPQQQPQHHQAHFQQQQQRQQAMGNRAGVTPMQAQQDVPQQQGRGYGRRPQQSTSLW